MCTIIAVGKQASADGSVIISHSDAGPDSRIRKISARQHPRGALAPVHFGMVDIRSSHLEDLGEVIGHIPQVERTHAYFHSAYSHVNEHQLAIAESTLTQRDELLCERGQGEQIMTVEQAMVFALQRCKTPREAIELIGGLMEAYGFLSSCAGGGELLCLANLDEVWVMEIVGVGKDWKKDSGQPGAVWVAQRMKDDEALVVANWSIIRAIDVTRPDTFLACAHYQSFAQEKGWYDPARQGNFIWQEVYFPLPHEWATERLWLFYSSVAPTFAAWPDRKVSNDPYKTLDQYAQVVEPLSLYPFSVQPEKPLGMKDIIAFHRSTFEGTIYDITAQPQWLVPDDKGQLSKSPLATPFPTPDTRRLLKLTRRRTVARHFGHYGMVCQLRQAAPNGPGSLYWIYLDNPHISPFVPAFIETDSVHPCYSEYDPEVYSDTSARWCIDFVDNLAQLEYQNAIKDIIALRDVFENDIATDLATTEAALALEANTEKRKAIATEFTHKHMAKVPGLYITMRNALIVKYTNNKK